VRGGAIQLPAASRRSIRGVVAVHVSLY